MPHGLSNYINQTFLINVIIFHKLEISYPTYNSLGSP